jgi:ferric-dicitrate binding protein FerR (iron transport regulator)
MVDRNEANRERPNGAAKNPRATGRNGLTLSLLGLALAAAFGLMLLYQPLSKLGSATTTGSGSGESGQATPQMPGAPLPSK